MENREIACCATCVYARPVKFGESELAWIECRQRSPTISLVQDLSDMLGHARKVTPTWPRVRAVDWCGDYVAVPFTKTDTVEVSR